jgi:pilus assembly protein CpaB
MRPKSLLLLIVAVGSGLVAAWGATQGTGEKAPQTVPVLMVVADQIPSHTPIKDEMVKFVDTPQSELLWDAITRKEDYEGKALSYTATRGEMLTKSKLTDRFNASTEIEKGKRVVTVKVDLSTSHSGQIRPKDRVDVYTTYTTGQFGGVGGGNERKTKRVLSRIEVFSIDSTRASSSHGNDDVMAKTVSLMVDPEQASVLMMAEKMGVLHLALRNKFDESDDPIPVLTEKDFDRLLSDDPTIATARESEQSVQASFTDSDEYQAMMAKLKQLENLESKLANLEKKDQEKIKAEIEKVTAPEIPPWTITVFSGRDKKQHEFKEPAPPEAGVLPDLPEGDSSRREEPGRDSTTLPEVDQPMNTALRADSSDK